MQRVLRVATDEILLAGLGRTIARTIGDGVVAVDLEGHGRLVLKPEVDLHRTRRLVHHHLPDTARVREQREYDCDRDIGRSSPNARGGAALRDRARAAEVRVRADRAAARCPPFTRYLLLLRRHHSRAAVAGDGPCSSTMDAAMPMRESLPALGHAIELRMYRVYGQLQVDWWYDTRRVERSNRCSAGANISRSR